MPYIVVGLNKYVAFQLMTVVKVLQLYSKSGGKVVHLINLASSILMRPPHDFGRLLNMILVCFNVQVVFKIFAGEAGKNFI